MSGNKFTILSGSKNCYLFNRSTFFKGFPPQSIVTQHFVASKDEYNYETFPVRDDEAGDYLFLDWNDPEAKKVWEPYVKNGTLIEHPKLFQDDDDYEFTEDQEANDRLREEIQERRELFEYYNKQADVSLTDFSRENFSDPIEAFRSLFSNAFVPDEYASTLDEIVHSFISNDIDHPTDTTYSEIATDVAAINLQMLAGTPPEETKLIDQRSYPLAKLVNEQIPPDQSLEQRLLLLNYLSNIQDEARDDMHKITSISNALLLIGQNTIVDSDNPAFDKFCHRYHGSALTILPFFKRYLDHALNSNSFVNAETLKSNAERFGRFFTYSKYVEIMQAKNSPTSPDYHPVSPGKEIEPVIDQEKDPIIKEEEFKIVMVCITNYLFFCFGETFKPRKDYISNFFRSSIDIKDFFRRFRLRYKYVYFAKPYKLELIKAIDSFVKTYVNEATSFSVVEIFKFDGNPKVAEDFEIIEREV